MIKTLNECLELTIDRRGVTPKKLGSEWKEKGYKVLSANNIKTSGLQNLNEIRFIDEETYRKWMKEEIKKGDLLLTSEAPAGEVLYWDSDEKIVAGQRVYILRTKKEINSLFLKYYLQSKKGQSEIRNKCSGSTVFGISAKTFDSIEIILPEKKENQDKIANILYFLDKKINNNNRIYKNLENIAKTIYDYWFLQFEFPNDDDRPYKSSGGRMIWNADLKKEIPAGWDITTIDEITLCHDSKRIPLSSSERAHKKGVFPYYGATGIMDYVRDFIFDGNYVLMAEDGSVMNPNGTPILQRITGKTWVNNHAHVLEPVNGYNCKLLMMLLKDVSVAKIKTGSIQMKINQENMNKIIIPKIPDKLLRKINYKLDIIDKYQLQLIRENEKLSKLRDFLLPLLINGQVGFKS
ncbi:MAG: restriction endonuclease subunit S [Bacilli bacterium]|nr:restriction endonuclease subunit S [Bacilli bacterium]